jgi:hypothetical protein
VRVAPEEVKSFVGRPFTHLLMWIAEQERNALVAKRIS